MEARVKVITVPLLSSLLAALALTTGSPRSSIFLERSEAAFSIAPLTALAVGIVVSLSGITPSTNPAALVITLSSNASMEVIAPAFTVPPPTWTISVELLT